MTNKKNSGVLQKEAVHQWKVYIDGASRNNPGEAGAGIVMIKDNEVVCREGFYLGIKTNNQAEYYALLLCLFFIHQYAHTSDLIRIISDSELLVKQILGTYRIKNEGLKPLFRLAQFLLKPYTIDILHVIREENTQADMLANNGINIEKPVPASFVSLLRQHNIVL